MRVARENKESLMAVLEAFVYDPLFAWKLVATAPADAPAPEGASCSTLTF
jgi:FKBP12-rapamycin complex-associated protein